MNLTKTEVDNFISKNYSQVETLKHKFKTWQPDNVEDAFQVSYYNLIMNLDQLELNGSVERTVMSYLHTSMSNKLKTYKRNSAYQENVDFVDSNDEDQAENSYMVDAQEDVFDAIDTRLALESLRQYLRADEFELIWQVYGEGKLINHLAIDYDVTYYTMNSRVSAVMAKAEKFLK
jgi:DNA-directed RNA polymerase specialized sigma24 family protein